MWSAEVICRDTHCSGVWFPFKQIELVSDIQPWDGVTRWARCGLYLRTNSHGKDRHVSTYELFRGPPCSGKLDEKLAEQAVYLKRKTKTKPPNIIFREIKNRLSWRIIWGRSWGLGWMQGKRRQERADDLGAQWLLKEWRFWCWWIVRFWNLAVIILNWNVIWDVKLPGAYKKGQFWLFLIAGVLSALLGTSYELLSPYSNPII